ncbi:Protein CROWDED NUCLEI like [Actinidia chinensis var. chinensis]|uniref:Protein CROWDED NUCLEI like n=1 Tax=Actinidia chinensis var. chinensis TaxID=1590841 RepID=A0A2R6PTU0_ACTCC|nr:Protein CROWDED NUCLEI like [Actinidia chinensis var. chinensis]
MYSFYIAFWFGRWVLFCCCLGGGEGEAKPGGKKKFITRDEEPEQYWQTAGERKGENPMTTPIPYIIIFGMSTPFVILAIAFANGWIKVPVR